MFHVLQLFVLKPEATIKSILPLFSEAKEVDF